MLKMLKRQPVRTYLYGVLIPGEAVAVAYGLVSEDKGALWLALGAAALLVPGVEAARAKVTPLADPRTADGRPAEILPEPADPPGGSWLG